MTTATVRDLRNHFSKLAKKLARGEVVQIISRGKPIARLVPERGAAKTFVGVTPVDYDLPEDLEAPVPVEWDAAK